MPWRLPSCACETREPPAAPPLSSSPPTVPKPLFLARAGLGLGLGLKPASDGAAVRPLRASRGAHPPRAPFPLPSLPFPSSSSPRRRGGRCGFVLFIASSLPRCGLGYCCCRREESFFFLFDRMMLEDSCVRTRLVWLLARCSAAGCPAGGFGGGFFALLFGSPLAGRLLGQWELLFFPEGTLLGFPVLVPLPVRDRIFWWIGGATIPMIMNHRRVDCPCDFRFLIGLPIARSELR